MGQSISIWTWCASTFCFYNIVFMICLSSLFIYKLVMLFNKVMENNDPESIHHDIVDVIVKTILLGLISIAMTMTSCVFLIIRFSFMIQNYYIDIIGNTLISVDIYSNFIFITMSFKYFNKYYLMLFGCLHSALKRHIAAAKNIDIDSTKKQKKANTDSVKQKSVTTNSVTSTSEHSETQKSAFSTTPKSNISKGPNDSPIPTIIVTAPENITENV